MLLIKIVLSFLIVVCLSLVAERLSPKWAGILAGFPTGSAITLFFYGVEISPEFAAESSLYNIAGILPLLAFVMAYYFGVSFAKKRKILFSSIFSMAVYFIAAFFVKIDHATLTSVVLLALGGIFMSLFTFRRISNKQRKVDVRLKTSDLLIRSSMTVGIILLITTLAKYLSSSWAGVFSAFPTTVFPLLLIVHTAYGAESAKTVMKNVPLGLLSLILYSVTIHFTYPSLGVVYGTMAGFAAALSYLFVIPFMDRLKRHVPGHLHTF